MHQLPSTPAPHGPEAAAGVHEPEDFALGFECADPSLQIDRWCDEAPRAGATAEAA